MFQDKREESEFVVSVLDMKALAKMTVIDLIGNGYEINGNTRITTHYPLGIVTAKSGKRYIVDEDGYGVNPALENERQRISWYKHTVDEKENTIAFDMFPFVEVTYTKEEIESVPVTKTVTLDKFIRTSGGGRVSRNFGKWTKFLITGIEPSAF
jgi:hypothetical protein